MEIKIPGKPVPWKRARRNGNKYFDAQVKEKQSAYWSAKMQMGDLPPFFSEKGGLKVTFKFYMRIPKSLSNKKKLELAGASHTKKPDLSNLIKFIEDALIGVLWVDDDIISEIVAKKIYDKNPRTIITIEETKN